MRQKFEGSSWARGVPLCEILLILEGGLVTVVAVGDEDGFPGHRAAESGVRLLVGDDPEPVFDAQVIGRDKRSAVAQACFEGALHEGAGIGIETEHRAQVEAGGLVKCQPVGFRAGHGLLMRIDLALADRLEPHPRQEPLARMLRSIDQERLLIDVKSRMIFLAENALAEPILENPLGAGIAIKRARVTGLVPVQLQADHVIGTGLVEPVLEGLVDDVIGGRHDVGQRSHACDIIAGPAKRAHVSHCSLVPLGKVRSPFPNSRGISSVRPSRCRA